MSIVRIVCTWTKKLHVSGSGAVIVRTGSRLRLGMGLAIVAPRMANDDRWILGLDGDERGVGALVFADWLAHGGDDVVGVHVLEAWTRPHIFKDVSAAIQARVWQTYEKLGLTPPNTVVTIEAVRAEDGLVDAASAATGLVIGRAARGDSEQFVRLGVVARHLLRQLPVPVVVVPPDWTAVDSGPVLLGTDLGASSEAAAAFARDFAARHGRALELVHVGERRHGGFIAELGPNRLAAYAEYQATLTDDAHAWAARHGLPGAPCHIVYGDPVRQICAVAAVRRAALVVVGSRHLGLIARSFLSSTASALAGYAVCPVAVVPFIPGAPRPGVVSDSRSD